MSTASKNLVGRRLTRMSVIASAVTLLLASSAFLAYEYYTFRDALVRNLETHAQIIGINSESAILFNDAAAATETLAALRAEPHIVSIRILRVDGTPFAAFVRPNATPAELPGSPLDEPDGPHFTSDRLFLAHHIMSDRARIGMVYLEADLDEMAARFVRYAAIVGGVIVCSLVVGLFLSARLQRRIIRPIFALADAARTVSVDKNYSVRVPTDGEDELAMLGRTFNEMLSNIEERDQALRRARDELEERVAERTEALKRQNQRVEEANRLKSEFLANMSHELRTPLNAIIGFSELLHDGKVGPMATKQKEFLNNVLISSRHLLKLINDILDLSKVEAGKMEFRPEPVVIAELVMEVIETVRALAAKKRLGITSEIDPSIETVLLDRSKLKQVLYNYVSNAIKFTGDDGTIVIRVVPEGASEFRLEVQDSGIGIREDDLRHLFVEFRQLDSTAGKKYQGTGLGLALTKRLLEAQGGRWGVESVLGKGSTFFAILPRVAVSAERAADPSPRQGARRGE
jgi:signal transduction histidine kinase